MNHNSPMNTTYTTHYIVLGACLKNIKTHNVQRFTYIDYINLVHKWLHVHKCPHIMLHCFFMIGQTTEGCNNTSSNTWALGSVLFSPILHPFPFWYFTCILIDFFCTKLKIKRLKSNLICDAQWNIMLVCFFQKVF